MGTQGNLIDIQENDSDIQMSDDEDVSGQIGKFKKQKSRVISRT